MKRIWDKSFVYKNAASTDVAATFRRIRREQAAQHMVEQERIAAEAQAKVRQIKGHA